MTPRREVENPAMRALSCVETQRRREIIPEGWRVLTRRQDPGPSGARTESAKDTKEAVRISLQSLFQSLPFVFFATGMHIVPRDLGSHQGQAPHGKQGRQG